MRTPLLGTAVALLLAAGSSRAQLPPPSATPSPYNSRPTEATPPPTLHRVDGLPRDHGLTAQPGHGANGHGEAAESHKKFPEAKPWLPKGHAEGEGHGGEGHGGEGHHEEHEEEHEEEAEGYAPPIRLWLNSEFLLWWVRRDATPILVTTGQPDDPLPGALGGPFTRIVFGGEIDYQRRPGGRFTGGLWLNDCATFGVEASYLFLGSRKVHFVTFADGGPNGQVLARPFVNAETGAADVELVAFPNFLSGLLVVDISSRFDGLEANGLANLYECRGCRVDLITGARYLSLEEGLGVIETSGASPDTPVYGGSTIEVIDTFNTKSRFYGGQIGARAEVASGRLFVNTLVKVGLGVSDHTLDITGSTRIFSPRLSAVPLPGGLLAQPSNIGTHTRQRFAVVPEVGVNLGYEFNRHVRMTMGYSFLYWSQVLRVGDQIDTVVNVTQVATSLARVPSGPPRPAPLLADTDFWAQGINFGLELRY